MKSKKGRSNKEDKPWYIIFYTFYLLQQITTNLHRCMYVSRTHGQNPYFEEKNGNIKNQENLLHKFMHSWRYEN